MLRVLSARKPRRADRVAAEVAGGLRELEEDSPVAIEDAEANVSARTAVARDCLRSRSVGPHSCGRGGSRRSNKNRHRCELDQSDKQTSLQGRLLPTRRDVSAPGPAAGAKVPRQAALAEGDESAASVRQLRR